jgi:glycosyltransferase involved in cell wall biosynthesis
MNGLAHVLLYTDDPDAGGVAQYNHALLGALASRGYRLTCVQSYADTPLTRRQAELGVRHVWLDYHTTRDFDRTVTDSAGAYQVLAACRPDLVIFSNGCPVSNFAARTVAGALGLPFVVVENFAAPFLAERFAGLLAALAGQYARARAVIAVSQENLDVLRRYYRLPPEQGQVIYYGRPDLYFRPPDQAARARLRGELGVPPDGVLCFTAARLDPLKGHGFQLAAIDRLRKTPAWAPLSFAWAGTGPLAEELSQAVAAAALGDRVKLLGQRWDLPDLLDAADVFLLPSQAEGMPLAIMEAMARGLPVAASAVSGIPEELGDTGRLLPDPNADAAATVTALVETLTAWAADAGLRRSVGAACRQRAEELFREERMLAQTVAVVERALVPPGDYVTPGLAIVRPDACFPFMAVGDAAGCAWPYLRREVPHNWYVDSRIPTCGWLSRDEVQLLYHNARQFAGQPALEIGCFLGWSTCHLALAGVALDVIDPLLGRADFHQAVADALTAAGVLDRVRLIGSASPAAVELLGGQGRRWALLFIDGDHEGEAPLRDAEACARFATEDALILFHDLASPAVARGLDYLHDHGWQVLVYQTMQVMGAAWRGNVRPVAHQPDPGVAWTLPEHLRGYPVSGW